MTLIPANIRHAFHPGRPEGSAAFNYARRLGACETLTLCRGDPHRIAMTPHSPNPSPPLIRAAALERIYSLGNGQVVGLRGVDFEVQPGDFVVLKGASGSGQIIPFSSWFCSIAAPTIRVMPMP